MQKHRFAAIALICAIAATLASTPAAADEIVMPRVILKVAPELPEGAAPRDLEVLLAVSLDVTGSVTDVSVIKPQDPGFDGAAMAAVRKWKFSPALRDGQPFAVKIKVPVTFVAAAPPAPTASAAPQGPPPAAAPPPKQPVSPPEPRAATPPKPAPSPAAAAPPAPVDIRVGGQKPPPWRGVSEFHIDVGSFELMPNQNATKILEHAPSIFLTNEGGEGHAERVYLRGFDAREGQDIEFSAGGVPINESGNLHGAGFADLHFVIPELVLSLRVLEGPFDPRQGNYAVAGSADYELGLKQRGVTLKYTYGTFNTHRALALWGPTGESNHTFGGVTVQTSDGYGRSRASKSASAMGQYEGKIGETGVYHFLATAYANDYRSAGLLRADDVESKKKGFYDTYDPGQGGSGSRFSLSGDVHVQSGDADLYQQAFVVQRGMRLREDFTGFLLDTQTAIQQPHGQRGDMLDLAVTETTFGARGHVSLRGELFGQKQELEVGYFARGDRAYDERARIAAATDVPYKTDSRYDSTLGDIGLYLDTNLRFTRWLSVRGGVRADLLTYDVLDLCAVQGVSRPSETDPPGDQSCLDQQRFGVHREPFQRTTTTGLRAMPRGSLLVGPFRGFTLSLSAGTGIRSMDPRYVTEDAAAQFASVDAYEGGVSYMHDFGFLDVAARSILFGTHVDRDLVFSESEGRSVIGGGTTRVGWIGQARAGGDFFDTTVALTLTKSYYDETGLLVPYVPDAVLRWDAAVFHDLPLTVLGHVPRASAAFGMSYIGRRALPYGQRSDTIFDLDAGVTLGYRRFELSVSATNLLDTAYRQAEFNFVSDWRRTPAPALVPARHFSAGAPREVLFSLTANFGGGAQ